MNATLPSPAYQQEPDDIEGIFNDLVQVVIQETRSESSIEKITTHPAYQQTIGLGTPAVPLLLREERLADQCFWALKAISRFDPVAASDRGKTSKIIEAWLQWGTDAGYKWEGAIAPHHRNYSFSISTDVAGLIFRWREVGKAIALLK